MTPDDPCSGLRPQPPEYARNAELPAVEWVRQAGAEAELLAAVTTRVRRRARRRWAASSSLVLLLAAGLFWSNGLRRSGHRSGESAGSSLVVSAPRHEVLPDGSLVELGDDAKIAVDFTGPFRRVVLRQGQALFSVVKNHERPFIVAAGGVEVRAIGTAFAVNVGGDGVGVLVTEGRVAVDDAGGPPPALSSGITRLRRTLAVVDAGHRVQITANDPAQPLRVAVVSHAEMDSRLSWRIPRLELSRTPLADVVEFMNARNQDRLVIADPGLGNLALSGFIRADNTTGLVALLESQFGVTAEHRGDNAIVLRNAP